MLSAESYESPQQDDKLKSTFHNNNTMRQEEKRNGYGYSRDKIDSTIDTIISILPIGPDKWKEVAELHIS